MRLPLRLRLRLTAVLPGTLGIMVLALSFMAYDASQYRDHAQRELEVLGSVVGASCAAPLLFDDAEYAANALASLASVPQIVGAALYDRDMQPFAHYKPVGSRADDLTRPSGITTAGDGMFLKLPVSWDDETIGFIAMEMDLADLHARQLHLTLLLSLCWCCWDRPSP